MAIDGDMLTSNVPIASHAFNAENDNRSDIEERVKDDSSSSNNSVDIGSKGGP